MPSVTAADLDYTEDQIIEMCSRSGSNGFTADSCGTCHKTANVQAGTSDWFCPCGAFNNLPWSNTCIPHQNPDLGPSLETIQSAMQKTRDSK